QRSRTLMRASPEWRAVQTAALDSGGRGGFASAFQQRLDGADHVLDGHHALKLLERAVLGIDDEERRRGIHAELLRGKLEPGFHQAQRVLVADASVEALLAEADLPRKRQQRLTRVLHERPVLLLGEQRLNDGEILILRRTAREREGPRRDRIEREVAQDQAHLTGVDVT